MSTVIKAARVDARQAAMRFNLHDVGEQGQEYLRQVQARADQIIADAQVQAVAIRRQAEEDGHDAARQTAETARDLLLGRQLESLLPALRQAADGLRGARQECLAQWEQQVVHLAAAMAARVIRRELARSPEIALNLVREALELAAGSPQVRIHLHPADYASLGKQIEAIAAEVSRLGPASLMADEGVTPGGCRVETRFGAIDQQIESQLARIEEELC
jgi:flagellar assembly protein FliH